MLISGTRWRHVVAFVRGGSMPAPRKGFSLNAVSSACALPPASTLSLSTVECIRAVSSADHFAKLRATSLQEQQRHAVTQVDFTRLELERRSTHPSVAVTTKSPYVNAALQAHARSLTHSHRAECHKLVTPRQMRFALSSAWSC